MAVSLYNVESSLKIGGSGRELLQQAAPVLAMETTITRGTSPLASDTVLLPAPTFQTVNAAIHRRSQTTAGPNKLPTVKGTSPHVCYGCERAF